MKGEGWRVARPPANPFQYTWAEIHPGFSPSWPRLVNPGKTYAQVYWSHPSPLLTSVRRGEGQGEG